VTAADERTTVSTEPAPALRLLRALISRGTAVIDGGLVAEALAEIDAVPPLEDGGSGPGGDFLPRDLQARYRKGASWVRQRLADGSFGTTYSFGRERVASRAGVEAFDARLRGSAADAAQPASAPRPARRTASSTVSLVEERKRRRGA
jgi:hypothetical protein